MALPGKAGRNYASMMSGAKRGAFARSPVTPSAAKRGVFAQSPSAAKKGIFAFSPGGGQSFAPSPTSFASSPRQAEDQSMKLLQQRRDQTRRDFFDNRQDVSPNRLDRRQIQQDLMDQFRNTQMKDVVGATGLKQSIVPGGPTMADRSMELARMYGPTLGEIGSDIKYAFGSMGRGLAEKGTPLMNLMKSIYGGVQSFFTPDQGSGTTAQGPMGLTRGQENLYYNLIGNGMNPQMALEQAKRYVPEGNFPKSFAVGGIATLN